MSPSSSPKESDPADEDERLLGRIGSGDREALRQLYHRYRLPLFTVAMRMVNDRGSAEELLQDCFVKIWRSAGTYDRRKARPFTWTVTILRRVCIDHLRRRRPAPAEIEADTVHTGDIVRAAAARHEMSEQLSEAFVHLQDGPRAALELALFSGLTHDEIAQRLGQPLGTAKSWIRRGLIALRGELQNLTP